MDEPVTSTLLNKHHSRIISMLKSCFPLTKEDVTIKNYFHSPLQRIVCLYKWKKPTMEKEIMAVCFLQKLDTDQCFIHSVCVQKKSQGKKCCDRLISYVVETYGKVYDLSLYVRVDKYKTDGLPANTPAIQCYRKSGFMFVEEPCSIQKDGLNCRMVRKKLLLNNF
jgi:ribosomal protein S18 acetylase RimI-like enzyme